MNQVQFLSTKITSIENAAASVLSYDTIVAGILLVGVLGGFIAVAWAFLSITLSSPGWGRKYRG